MTSSCHAWQSALLLLCVLCAGAVSALAAVSASNPAEELRARYAASSEQLKHNPFQQPLFLDSSESSKSLKGDIYALVDYPLATFQAALDDPADWCDVLILHLNTQYCHVLSNRADAVLTINIGAKYEQPLEDTYRVNLTYRAIAATPDYFQVRLYAEDGPLGTSNYRILLEAISVAGGQTFLHLTYSYDYGVVARLAMKTYLATVGRNKVGFTRVGKQANGQPDYMGGVRGSVERNTMRYFLAIDAYLSAVSSAPATQLNKRLQHWFTATERYPRQLREVDRGTYLKMKYSEHLRQQTAQ